MRLMKWMFAVTLSLLMLTASSALAQGPELMRKHRDRTTGRCKSSEVRLWSVSPDSADEV